MSEAAQKMVDRAVKKKGNTLSLSDLDAFSDSGKYMGSRGALLAYIRRNHPTATLPDSIPDALFAESRETAAVNMAQGLPPTGELKIRELHGAAKSSAKSPEGGKAPKIEDPSPPPSSRSSSSSRRSSLASAQSIDPEDPDAKTALIPQASSSGAARSPPPAPPSQTPVLPAPQIPNERCTPVSELERLIMNRRLQNQLMTRQNNQPLYHAAQMQNNHWHGLITANKTPLIMRPNPLALSQPIACGGRLVFNPRGPNTL
jgi:hypothetical protein